MRELLIAISILAACGKDHRAKPAAALNCPKVLECYGACSDEPCRDGCIARATPDAKATTLALVQCMANSSCRDQDCITTNCNAELVGCAGDPATAGAAGGAGGTDVQALVGDWLGRAEVFTHYVIDADGGVRRWLRVGTTGYSGHTTYTDGLEEHGTLTQDGDAVVFTWKHLDFSKRGTERFGVTWVDFIDYKHTPKLTDLDCTATTEEECAILLTKF